ncbi:hypothetical protein PGB90_005037 [Kerria lacca]
MKEVLSKMAELKFEAPLAQFEETEEWQNGDFRRKCLSRNENCVRENINTMLENETNEECVFDNSEHRTAFSHQLVSEKINEVTLSDTVNNNVLGDNFDETVSGSLEDLVNTFDEKITRCFYNYQESVENLAPVQVRSQEEIMNECQ